MRPKFQSPWKGRTRWEDANTFFRLKINLGQEILDTLPLDPKIMKKMKVLSPVYIYIYINMGYKP